MPRSLFLSFSLLLASLVLLSTRLLLRLAREVLQLLQGGPTRQVPDGSQSQSGRSSAQDPSILLLSAPQVMLPPPPREDMTLSLPYDRGGSTFEPPPRFVDGPFLSSSLGS